MKYKVIDKQYNYDDCFICGIKNDAGLKCEFYNCFDENDEKVLITKVTGKDIHQSYPNRMHGGVISAILDESIGRAIQIDKPEDWAVTIDLNVKFRKPVPLNQVVYVVSKITGSNSRGFDGEGSMLHSDGTVLAKGTGKYFRVALKQAVQDVDLSHLNRHMIDNELPEFIYIG